MHMWFGTWRKGSCPGWSMIGVHQDPADLVPPSLLLPPLSLSENNWLGRCFTDDVKWCPVQAVSSSAGYAYVFLQRE
jgi:hypothetical protein